MAILGWIAVTGFALMLLSILFVALYFLAYAITNFRHKKFRPLLTLDDITLMMLIGILAFILGLSLARLTNDPISLQIGDMTISDLISLVQNYLYLAVAGTIGFAAYIYRKVTEIFNLLQDPHKGIHSRLTKLETNTETIKEDVTFIKNNVVAKKKS